MCCPVDDHSIRITTRGDLVEETPADRPALEMLDTDPADMASWLPVVESGRRVLLPEVPGSLPLVREAAAFGVLRLVADPSDQEQVEDERWRVGRRAVSDDELAALVAVLRRRMSEGRQARPEPGTAPRVLLLAFNRKDLDRAAKVYARVQRWGGESSS